jgi:hypothetical protein
MVFLIETRGPIVNNTKAVALGGYRAKLTGGMSFFQFVSSFPLWCVVQEGREREKKVPSMTSVRLIFE